MSTKNLTRQVIKTGERLDKIRGAHGGTRFGSGRPKGATNRIPSSVREMVRGALDSLGGEKYLIRLAEEHPASFCMLLGKLLPTTVAGDPESAPIQHAVAYLPEKKPFMT